MRKSAYILLIFICSKFGAIGQQSCLIDSSVLLNFDIHKSIEKIAIKQLGRPTNTVIYNRWLTSRPAHYKRYEYDSLGLNLLFYKSKKLKPRSLSSITIYPEFKEYLFDSVAVSAIDTNVLLNVLGTPDAISFYPQATSASLYWYYNLGDEFSFCFNSQGELNHISIFSNEYKGPRINQSLLDSFFKNTYTKKFNCTEFLDSLSSLENNIITNLEYGTTYSGSYSMLELTTSYYYHQDEPNRKEFYYNNWIVYFENEEPKLVIDNYKSFKSDNLDASHIWYFDLTKKNNNNPNFNEYWITQALELKTKITSYNKK